MTGTNSILESQAVSVEAARAAWLEHRHFRYRGCAPDADNPLQMAGNPELPVGAHHAPDVDGGESQKARRKREAAAVEVCLSCPVMVLCDRYANSLTEEGRLAEPDGVWGGRTGLERHKALIRARHAVPPAPDRRFETAKKRAVLRALAVCWDPYEVAEVASRLLLSWGEGHGMDVGRANWQRSNLTTLLGLPRAATRAQFLAAAGERGLLEGVQVVADDGSVPAVPPPTRIPVMAGAEDDDLCPPKEPPLPEPLGPPEPFPAPDTVPDPVADPEEPEQASESGRLRGPLRLLSPRRNRFTDVQGQIALWEAEDAAVCDLADLAEVHTLFPAEQLLAAA
jgi:hypothetical protein